MLNISRHILKLINEKGVVKLFPFCIKLYYLVIWDKSTCLITCYMVTSLEKAICLDASCAHRAYAGHMINAVNICRNKWIDCCLYWMVSRSILIVLLLSFRVYTLVNSYTFSWASKKLKGNKYDKLLTKP